jgi:hypothetical protein
MGGWKLLKNIKGLYKNMPRVISSGYVINTTDMSASGASYLMNKPLDKPSVIKILDNLKSHMPPLATVSYGRINPITTEGQRLPQRSSAG